MKNYLTYLLILICCTSFAQSNNVQTYKLNQDFGQIIQSLSDNYIYLKDKKTDFECVKEKYSAVIGKVKTNQEKVLFFEYLLDEFYDSHLMLNTKTKSSFRLHSPIYLALKDNKFYVKNIWSSQMKDYGSNIIDAEVLNFNSKKFNKVIDAFPTQCVNKNLPEVREWIANKIISGRYNESRVLTLRLTDDRKISLNVDNIKIKKERTLLTTNKKNDVGVIRINNSLGKNNLIKQFDKELNSLINTKALVLDLRNTIDGGNSYVTNAIMSRFINKEMPYQKQISKEKYGNNPEIIKTSLEYVSPRGIYYNKPVIVLVGKWTGDVAEGLAIGLDGMNRAKIVGSEMGKFAGSTTNYSFKNSKYSYSVSTDKLYHVNGLLREDFVPSYNVVQTDIQIDNVLEKALNLIDGKDDDNFVVALKAKNSVAIKMDK
ncbi:MAG: S41 family peptidase [Polaribacter sp.]|uniref:S41 family peptidase n=1 Tax=Polaribacter sp. TaxID=1920175 RepID=UPI002F357226